MKKIVFTFLFLASFSLEALEENPTGIPQSVLEVIAENLLTEFLKGNVKDSDDSPLLSPSYSAYIVKSCERRKKVLAADFGKQDSLQENVEPYYLGAVLVVIASLYVKLELAVFVGAASGFLISDKNKKNKEVEKSKKDIESKFNKLEELKEKISMKE